MLEKQIEEYLIDKCNKNNILIFKLLPDIDNGLPDRLLLKNGLSFFIELKRPNKKPRKLQRYMIKKINKESIATYIDTKEKIDILINIILENKPYKETKERILCINDLYTT